MKKPNKKLLDTWDKKLAKAGFVDAEARGTGLLKRWDSAYYQNRYTPMEFLAKERYYSLARQHLEEGYFENGTHKLIWQLHTDGLTYREIAAKLKKTVKGTINKDIVNEVVVRCRKEAGIRND